MNDIPEGATMLERSPLPEAPPPGGTYTGSLKDMLSDAMAKSRGQGVVQGSTIFFKNLAESISHSNRNLKIGLAFLTGAFVVFSGTLGFVLYTSIQRQEATKSSLEQRLEGVGAESMRLLQPFVDKAKELEDRQGKLEQKTRADLENMLANARAEADNARAEAMKLRQEVDQLRADLTWTRERILNFEKVYQVDREQIVKRVEGR